MTSYLMSLQPEKMSGTIKQQLDSITPALQEMRLRKEERVNQFRDVQGQIQKISAEIAGQSEYDDSITNVKVNENDLSLKKLEEYQNELQRLHNEKVHNLLKICIKLYRGIILINIIYFSFRFYSSKEQQTPASGKIYSCCSQFVCNIGDGIFHDYYKGSPKLE